MKSEKILSHKLFLQRENAIQHQGYEIELVFYEAVKNGDFETLKKVMQPLQSDKLGILSKNPIRNLKYHLIITLALITRFCIEGGLPHETAYTLSDIYIQQLDVCNDVESIVLLHREVTYDFTNRMKELKKTGGYSKKIHQAIDYIYDHLHEKILLDDMADILEINKSYLCELFKKETGTTINQYITKLKIEAAANMLIYGEFSTIEISNYFAFSSHSHFISVFKKLKGYTPLEFKKMNYRKYFSNKLSTQ